MDNEKIIEEIEEIKNLLTGLTSAVEDVKSEVSLIYNNMGDNYEVESLLEKILTELKKISEGN